MNTKIDGVHTEEDTSGTNDIADPADGMDAYFKKMKEIEESFPCFAASNKSPKELSQLVNSEMAARKNMKDTSIPVSSVAQMLQVLKSYSSLKSFLDEPLDSDILRFITVVMGMSPSPERLLRMTKYLKTSDEFFESSPDQVLSNIRISACRSTIPEIEKVTDHEKRREEVDKQLLDVSNLFQKGGVSAAGF
ncbi:MAG: hypothetical protein HQK96_13550 [Nitrospirae bacterium]|nr:hypothetical protein [Nitrospirota bacterium]